MLALLARIAEPTPRVSTQTSSAGWVAAREPVYEYTSRYWTDASAPLRSPPSILLLLVLPYLKYNSYFHFLFFFWKPRQGRTRAFLPHAVALPASMPLPWHYKPLLLPAPKKYLPRT